jgi:hypothetical protein
VSGSRSEEQARAELRQRETRVWADVERLGAGAIARDRAREALNQAETAGMKLKQGQRPATMRAE